jgi:hypothetical protein
VRVSFELRQATHHRKPWAARICVLVHA